MTRLSLPEAPADCSGCRFAKTQGMTLCQGHWDRFARWLRRHGGYREWRQADRLGKRRLLSHWRRDERAKVYHPERPTKA